MLPKPNLDDRTYAQLIEEARGLIPIEYPDWTDHNPTDTGIILLELFAWLTEMVLYRVNQIPDKNIDKFLQLIEGANWSQDTSLGLQEEIQKTVLELRKRYRAVTCEDFEQLILKDWHETTTAKDLGVEGTVIRAKCVPQHDLTALKSAEREALAPGHVSLVVLSKPPDLTYEVLEFNGQTNYVDLGDILNPADQSWTVEMLFKCDRTQGKNIIYNKEKLYTAWVRDGYFQYAWRPTWRWTGGDSFPVAVGKWYHAAVVYDGSQQHLYQNGVRVYSRAQTGNIGSNASKLLIAARGDTSPNSFFAGQIAEFRIWNKARQPEEIKANMNRQLAGSEPGLVGYWPLDEGAGNIVYDKTANQNQGTIQPSLLAVNWERTTTKTRALPKMLMQFDGAKNYVTIPGESIPSGNEITVSFWAKGGDLLPKITSAITALDNRGIRVLNIHLPWKNSVLYFDCGGSEDGSFDRIEKAVRAIEYKGNWTHWAFTKNVSSGEMKIYLNGSLWHSGSGKTKLLQTTETAQIGNYPNSSAYYHGTLSELRIWNKARTQKEIQADMYRQLTGTEAGLVSYWILDEGEGNIVYDKTAKRYRGEATEAQWVASEPQQTELKLIKMPKPTAVLKQALWQYLDERRLLTTHHHIAAPEYLSVKIMARLYLQDGAKSADVSTQAVEIVRQFFDPISSGAYWDGKGWPFGRPVYVSELYELFEKSPGVDYAQGIALEVSGSVTTQLSQSNTAGENKLTVATISGFAPGTIVRIDPSSSDREYHTITETDTALKQLTLGTPLTKPHADGTMVICLRTCQVRGSISDPKRLPVSQVAGFGQGDLIRIDPGGGNLEDRKIESIDSSNQIFVLTENLQNSPAAGATVVQLQSGREQQARDGSLSSIILADRELVAVEIDENSFAIMERLGDEWRRSL